MRQIRLLKHGEIVRRLEALDVQIEKLQSQQEALIKDSRQIDNFSTYANLACQVRGKRRYLHWRQKYHKRQFFKLYDDHGIFALEQFQKNPELVKEVEKKRLFLNHEYQNCVQEREGLVEIKSNLAQIKTVFSKVASLRPLS